MPEELLTPEELIAWLKLPSVETLYQWRLRKVGPKALKIGRHLRYSVSEVERWLERQAG